MKSVARIAIALYLCASGPGINAAEIMYTFGIAPQGSAIQTAKDWTPILQALEQRTGLQFRFATARDEQIFSQRVRDEAWDFVYMSPDEYVNEDRSENSYVPIARARNVKIKGIVVVRQDSTAEKLEDLDHRSIAVPNRSFAADVVPQAVLRNTGITVTAQPLASQNSAYQSVIEGRATASGGTTRSFSAMLPEARNALRVLWTSEGFAPHAITAHTRVPQDISRRVQEALIDLHLDTQGKKLLKAIAPEGLDYAKDEDWNDVRELDL